MEKRTGLVITGPRDGEFFACPSQYFKAAIMRKVPAMYEDFAFDSIGELMTEGVYTFSYKHTEMWFRNDDERTESKYGFWVPEGEKSPNEFVIKNLAAFYVEHAAKK